MSYNISATERRNAHAAGYSVYAFQKQSGADLATALVPDESGIIGTEVSLRSVASFTTTPSVMYTQFLGRATGEKALRYITAITSGTVSSGVTTKVGFAVSSGPPAFAGVTLTIRTSTTLDTTGAVGPKTTADIDYHPDMGEYIWVYSQHSTGTTQPTLYGIGGELGAGNVQTKVPVTTAPAVGSTQAMSLIAAALTAQAPLYFIR